MSELDWDNAKTIDDAETDSIEEIEEDTDETVQVAEMTDRTAFSNPAKGILWVIHYSERPANIEDYRWWKMVQDQWDLEVHLQKAYVQELSNGARDIQAYEEDYYRN